MEGLSVRKTAVARPFTGRASRVLASTLFLLAVAMAAPMLAKAANPAANIDQCRNGQVTAPVRCIDNAWQNGNLGPENSHYREGDSVPFRAVLTNLDASAGNTHTLVIQYDTLQSGKHAYDYLTSFNATETNADPVHDISGTSAGNCFTIPVDLTNMFANPGSTQEPGCIQIYNGTITSVVYGMDAPDSGQRTVIVNFTATEPTVVIAWGGHIASQIDWGAGNSASSISGSPYHMRLLTLDDTQLGNQDRSLKASGILPIPAVFTTQASVGQITSGQGTVTDTATLSGSNGPVTGTVKFFVCGPNVSNPDCTSGGTQVGGAVTIVGGQAVSGPFTPPATGHYCFRGEYTPDAFAPYSPSNHTDTTLECFTVTAQTAINTNAGGPFTIGVDGTVALSDTATLSGGTSDATGTITFTLFDNDTCTHAVGTASATVNGADGDQYASSPAIVVSATGTYHWIASYVSGDNKNSDTISACGAPNENPVVNPRPTTLTTNAGGPFLLGADGTVALSDTATLSGGTSGAGGTITFMLFSDSACSSQVDTDVTVAVNGADGKNYTSPPITVNAAGTYYWVASYGGDLKNAASSSTCGDVNETPLVIKPHISISKSPDAQTILIGQTANFTIAVTNDGNSTLTNVVVTDALAPGCARTSADIPGLASMAPGATITYTCTLAKVTASFTNIAIATGTPPLGPPVSAEDTAAVTAVAPATHPAITIVKNPKSQTVTRGGTATFTITVTNTGDVALTNVTVSDPLSPNCNRTIGTLAPGASTSYTCTRANVTANFTNVAVASGTAGGTTVTAQDTAPVTSKAAALQPKTVTKVKPKVVSHRKPKATG
jgi:uncharacterized repeat protein (TIGR01451 family)